MPQYEAEVHDVEAIRACAETYGFCLVRNVFDEVELGRLKAGMRELDARFGKQIPDIMSCPPIDWLITDERVLKIARHLLGDELVYYPETNVNFEPEIGDYTLKPFNTLHCDATGRPDDRIKNWYSPTDEIYRGYRFGLYFQDYSQFSGGLKVGVGTHRGDATLCLRDNGLDTSAIQRVEINPGQVARLPHARMPLYNVPARPGDLVVWNLRTIHAAGFRTLSLHPEIALHPDVETELARKVPAALRPIAGPRLALFFDFAAPSEDIDLYIKSRLYQLKRDDGMKFRYAHYDRADVTEILRKHRISARYDHLFYYLLVRWAEEPAERAEIEHRLLDLADRHREFSPHFPLFDRAAYDQLRGHNDERALLIVFDGVAQNSHTLSIN